MPVSTGYSDNSNLVLFEEINPLENLASFLLSLILMFLMPKYSMRIGSTSVHIPFLINQTRMLLPR
jgi:hypothetical protein